MILLIDGDFIVYRSAFAVQKKNKETGHIELEPVGNMCNIIKNTVLMIINRYNSIDYELYLSTDKSSSNRIKIDGNYKLNRKHQSRPVYYNEAREYLLKNWNAKLVYDAEADDMLGIRQYDLHESLPPWDLQTRGKFIFSENCRESLLVHQDKDINNIPGWHFNPVKEKEYYVSELEADRHFYKQLLMGDGADNIKGIKGLGVARSTVLLKDCASVLEMFEVVYNEYCRWYEEEALEKLLTNGSLLWISRHKLGEKWTPPER